MKVLKTILVAIGAIVVLALVIALFTKKEYAVERDISINRPAPVVFEYIRHLKNQDNYSKWANMDPGMKKTYSGTDGTVGFVSAWDSEHKDVGKGEQEIKKITGNERVDFELRFIEPFESTEAAYMTTAPIDSNKTEVTWGFEGKMDYPMNLMLLIMNMEEMIGEDLAEGLQNLKKELEK